MKKWMSLLLSVLLLVGLLPLGVAADSYTVTVDGLEYWINEDGAYLESVVDSEYFFGDLVLPEYVDGMPLISISSYVFMDNSNLYTVTIPSTVEYIGTGAFAECYNLTDIYVNAGNDNYYSVDGVLFDYWEEELKQYPAGRYGSYTIPSGTRWIADSAFYGCSNLTAVTIPSTVWEIGGSAFRYCYSLTSVVIPDSVAYIYDSAFEYCESLTSVKLGNGVQYIGVFAFSDCDALPSITIPNSVTYLANGAVSYNDSLTAITIGSGVEYIGNGAFMKNGCLSSISVSSANPYYCVYNGVLYDKAKTTLIVCPPAAGYTSYSIPATVTRIEYCAFDDCEDLSSITIPASVISVGNSAFTGTAYYNNANNWTDGVLYVGNYLVAVDSWTVSGAYTVKAGTKAIADGAFSSSYNLTAVTIPSSVVTIGDSAFDDCSSLVAASILGGGATTIGQRAFAYCGLTSLTIGNGVKSIGEYAFVENYDLTTVAIPDSVESIGEYAFGWNESLEDITIGNGVRSIGSHAFWDTAYSNNESNWEDNALYIGTYLVDVDEWYIAGDYTVKDGTTVLVDNAFSSSWDLTSVTLPDSVINISYCAFASCYNLTEVTIPDSVVSIDDYAFSDCYELTDVYYGGTEAARDQMDMGFANWCLEEATWHYSGCDHVYDHSCDATCNLCGAVREGVGHAYTDECDADCNNCGATRTPPHKFDHGHDGDCNLCGYTRDVAELKPGDVNGDGKVNVRDVGVLQQYINGWDVGDMSADPACDVNGDGKVNIRDLGLMQQFLNGWDVQLKLPA